MPLAEAGSTFSKYPAACSRLKAGSTTRNRWQAAKPNSISVTATPHREGSPAHAEVGSQHAGTLRCGTGRNCAHSGTVHIQELTEEDWQELCTQELCTFRNWIGLCMFRN